MPRYSCHWATLFALVILVHLPLAVQAKHFSRYPGDEDPSQKSLPRRSETTGQPTDAEVGRLDASEDGEDTGDQDEAVEDEPEEGPPGLFGYALHGSDGLKVEYIYTGDTFTNMRGGISAKDATRYLGLIDIALTADLEQMGFRPGGTFFMLAEDSHGMGLTEDFVGDVQWLDNMDPGAPFAQVSEYWWQRTFLDDRLTTRLGKQDPNAEFAVVDLGGDFVNSSFGIHSNLPMPTWPNTAMGVTTLADLAEPLTIKCGIFDGEADVGDWGISGTGTTFTLFECETQWNFDEGQLPGDFHIGLWYHSGQWSNLQDDDLAHIGNHGVYMGVEQMLWKEADDQENPQGLGAFFQFSQTQEDLNEVPQYFGSGLVYQGLVPCRDQDVAGVGVAQAVLSTYLDRPTETAVELFYKIQWSPHIVVEPDLQYIANPSGLYPDALVFGLRFEAVL